MAKTDKLTPKQEAFALKCRFFVYVIAIDGKVAYVGKGTGDRHLSHLRKSHNRELRLMVENARSRGLSVKARKIARNLTEREALKIERRLIVRNYDRLANASLGGRSASERAESEARIMLSQLKTEEQIVAEGGWGGISAEKRLQYYREIRQNLHNVIEMTREIPETFTATGQELISANASA